MAKQVNTALSCFLLLTAATPIWPQNTSTSASQGPAQPEKGIADVARQYRGDKTAPAPTPTPQAQSQQSLADIARAKKSAQRAEVKINDKNANELFADLEQITDFASNDTGLRKQGSVKHRLVSQDEVTQHWSAALSESEEAQRLARSEMVLKKFGYFPPDFSLKAYIVQAAAQSIAGYYDFRTKTMNLMNWIGLEEQRPIMAHELTHALQDQNYDLMSWESKSRPESRNAAMGVNRVDAAAESSARRAVVEGQAMIVLFDYLLKPYGRTLADTPSAADFIKNRMTGTYDTALVVHNAPLLLKDSAIFPYREGLMFELELLKKGGTQQAFADAFAHPPVDTHQVLEPKAYLQDEKIEPVAIPDLKPILGDRYEPYDSGTMGQLDVRIMAQQFGTENDMFSITPGWKGGSYVAVKRKTTAGAGPVSTADLALLYVSRWKDSESAQRFAELYRKSLAKRVTVSGEMPVSKAVCAEKSSNCGPVWASRVNTSEGPVYVELWPDDIVFIAHSFDEKTVSRLRQAVLRGHPGSTVALNGELSLRLLELPVFHAIQEQVAKSLTESLKNLEFK
jgi:hypothetical protein